MARGYFFDDDDPAPENDPLPAPVRRSGEVYFAGKRLFLPPFGEFDYVDFSSDIKALQWVPRTTLRVDAADGYRYQVWGLIFGPLGDITGYRLPELVIAPIGKWGESEDTDADEEELPQPDARGGGANTNDLADAMRAAYEPEMRRVLDQRNTLLNFLEEDPSKTVDGSKIAVGTNAAGEVTPVRVPQRSLYARVQISREQIEQSKRLKDIETRNVAKRIIAAEEQALAAGRNRSQGLSALVSDATIGTWGGIERSSSPAFASQPRPVAMSDAEFDAIERDLRTIDPSLYDRMRQLREKIGRSSVDPVSVDTPADLVIPTPADTARIIAAGRRAGKTRRLAEQLGIELPPGF